MRLPGRAEIPRPAPPRRRPYRKPERRAFRGSARALECLPVLEAARGAGADFTVRIRRPAVFLVELGKKKRQRLDGWKH